MAIDAISASAGAAAKIETGRTRLASSFDTFLTLLTTQLKNQDPTSPLDTNQFTQQLTQMSGVEQQLLTNDLLKSMVEKAGDSLTGAVGYIGKSVTVDSPTTTLAAGQAAWGYELDRTAASVKLDVVNAAGSVVHSSTADPTVGAHAFTWNGKDMAGTQLADGGRYTLRITATDSLGATMNPAIVTQGVVTAVEQTDGAPELLINGVAIPLSAVRAVRQSA